MKILFWGETSRCNGPGLVNRGFQTHLPENFLRIQTGGKRLPFLEGLVKLLLSQCLVVSGVSRQGCILMAVAGLLGKRTLYLMHGSAAREQTWYPDEDLVRQEAYLMAKAGRILCVSRMFRDWVRCTYPHYAHKTEFLYPGIAVSAVTNGKKIPGTLAAAGGDGGIKGNDILSRVVESMEGTAVLTVFGPVHKHHRESFTTYTGVLPREEFYGQLQSKALFVLNSRFESFSLSAVEALLLGCSVLVSEKAGVAEVLALEETDVIHDPEDETELRRKIQHLLLHPNCERLLKNLPREQLSWKTAVAKLEAYCEKGEGLP